MADKKPNKTYEYKIGLTQMSSDGKELEYDEEQLAGTIVLEQGNVMELILDEHEIDEKTGEIFDKSGKRIGNVKEFNVPAKEKVARKDTNKSTENKGMEMAD